MQIAVISPIKYLDFCKHGDIDMCLAHLALESKEYFDFYKKQVTDGRFVILDNGANEGNQISGKQLIDLAIDLKVSEVIAPDTFQDAADTNEKLSVFCKVPHYAELKKRNIKIQAVVQGRNIVEAWQHFQFLENRQSVDTIGLGFKCYDTTEFEHNTLSGMMSRIFLTNAIGHSSKPVHLLGLYNPIELKYQKKYSWIRSNDSSAPIMLALKGFAYKEYLESMMYTFHKPQAHLDFYELNERNINFNDLAIANMQTIKEWAK